MKIQSGLQGSISRKSHAGGINRLNPPVFVSWQVGLLWNSDGSKTDRYSTEQLLQTERRFRCRLSADGVPEELFIIIKTRIKCVGCIFSITHDSFCLSISFH